MIVALLITLAVVLVGGFAVLRVLRRTGNGRPSTLAGSDGPRVVTNGRGRAAIDPFAVNEPWRRFIQDALQARSRFDETVAATRPGPLRDRLREIGRSLDDGVTGTWAIARQGQRLRDARRRIDTRQVRSRLDAVQRGTVPNDVAAARSYEAQLAAAERLDAIGSEAEAKLRLMQAQLDEAVAHATELSVRSGEVGELSSVETEIARVAEQMQALRLALEEVNRTDGSAPS